MRILGMTLCLLGIFSCCGCSDAMGERKTPIALENVPSEILKIAQSKFPDVAFDSAFMETENGQSVFELKGKSKTGKIFEVEVTKDGKLLDD